MSDVLSQPGVPLRLPSPKLIVRPHRSADPRMRVICFPHAGAGAAIFHKWAQEMPPGVELCALRLPGRENRLDELAHTRLDQVADELRPALTPLLDRPFVLFGHCSGSIVAYDLAQRLRAWGAPQPAMLVVSAISGPSMRAASEAMYNLPSDAFLRKVAAYGGLDSAVLGDPELIRMFEPTLRADFRLAEEAELMSNGALEVPIVAISGRSDPFVDPLGLLAWHEETTGPYSMHLLDSGHFVLDAAMGLVRDLIGGA